MKPVKISEARKWWKRVERICDAHPPALEMVRMPWGFSPEVILHKSAWPPCSSPGCTKPAGNSTGHPGLGPCRLHAGNTMRGITEGYMIMATGYARMRAGVRVITPAEALLEILQMTRNDAIWLSEKVSTAENDDDLLIDMAPFVAMRERALDRYYKVAAAAHTAKALDVAQELEQAKAEVMSTILLPAIERMKVDEELRKRLLTAIDGELVALDRKVQLEIAADVATEDAPPPPF